MLKISIIIPVYRVEQYLRQCVDSVVNQTYQDIEIILVDDGSPDCCPQICDEYALRDHRIKVIHKENGGLSDARNKGIEAASGDYGIFIDSDDYWNDSCALDCLVDRLNKTNADILTFPYEIYDQKNGRKSKRAYHCDNMPMELLSKEKQLDYLTNKELYIASACNKIIKMFLLKDTPFEIGKLSEDIEWCAKLISKAQTFDYVNKCFYCYRQRDNSIAHTISEKNCLDLKDAIISCYYITENSSDTIKPYLETYSAYQYSTFIAVQSFSDKFPIECIQELSKYKGVLKSSHVSTKVRTMSWGTNIFGLVNWCRIIRITKPIWNSRRNYL